MLARSLMNVSLRFYIENLQQASRQTLLTEPVSFTRLLNAYSAAKRPTKQSGNKKKETSQ